MQQSLAKVRADETRAAGNEEIHELEALNQPKPPPPVKRTRLSASNSHLLVAQYANENDTKSGSAGRAVYRGVFMLQGPRRPARVQRSIQQFESHPDSSNLGDTPGQG